LPWSRAARLQQHHHRHGLSLGLLNRDRLHHSIVSQDEVRRLQIVHQLARRRLDQRRHHHQSRSRMDRPWHYDRTRLCYGLRLGSRCQKAPTEKID
jgi:hypothetical protein